MTTDKRQPTYKVICLGYAPATADNGDEIEAQLLFQVIAGPKEIKGKLLTIPAKFYVPPEALKTFGFRQYCIDTLMLKFGDEDTTKHFAHWVDTKTRSGWRRYSSTEHSLALPIRRDQLIEDFEAFCRTDLGPITGHR
jgi:hypothetical protein